MKFSEIKKNLRKRTSIEDEANTSVDKSVWCGKANSLD